MKDADLMTELVQVALQGVEDRTIKKLDDLYKQNDKEGPFVGENDCKEKLISTLEYIKNEMGTLFENDKIPAYFFYSIFTALIYNRYGIANVTEDMVDGYTSTGKFAENIVSSVRVILDMLREAEEKNENGRYKEFARACSSSTQRIANRRIRLKWLIKALQEPI